MLIMKFKYVYHGLISLYVNFHNNRTMWSTNSLVKICRWGGGVKGKRAGATYLDVNHFSCYPYFLALFSFPPPANFYM